jgi:hypothetical protein
MDSHTKDIYSSANRFFWNETRSHKTISHLSRHFADISTTARLVAIVGVTHATIFLNFSFLWCRFDFWMMFVFCKISETPQMIVLTLFTPVVAQKPIISAITFKSVESAASCKVH